MSRSFSSAVGSTRARVLAPVLSVALVATLLPASAAVAHHVDPVRPQTLLVDSAANYDRGRPLPTDVVRPSVSADGTRVVFEAPTVGGCDDAGTFDCTRLWLFERLPGDPHGTLQQLPLPLVDGATAPNGDAVHPAVSGDGRYVAFLTTATNLAGLAPIVDHRRWRAVRYDLAEGVLEQVDVHGDHVAPFEEHSLGDSFVEGVYEQPISVSHDGGRIAFRSAEYADAGDAIYVWDDVDGYAWPASLREGGGWPRRFGTEHPSLSPDGAWLAYQSPADMQEPGEGLSIPAHVSTQVWLQDLASVAVSSPHRVTSSADGTYQGQRPAVSDPAAVEALPYVAFSSAHPFAGPTTSVIQDVYRWDGNGGEPQFLRLTPSERGETFDVPHPTISADGSRVAYGSAVDDLVTDDTNAAADVFVATIVDGSVAVERASVATDGTEGAAGAASGAPGSRPAVSGDGTAVAFDSAALLDTEAVEGGSHVYVRDLEEIGLPPDPEGPSELTAGIDVLTAAPVDGAPTEVRISFTDPLGTAATERTYVLDWGDGNTTERLPFPANAVDEDGEGAAGTLELSHTYAAGSYTMQLTVGSEADPPATATATRDISVSAAPTLSVGAPTFSPAAPAEGQRVTATFPFDDSHARTPHTASVVWGDGTTTPATTSIASDGRRSFEATHTYRQDGRYEVTGTVVAADGVTATSAVVDRPVANAAPVIQSVAGTPSTGTAPLDVTVSADFTDAGVDDTHTATVEWGDGTDTFTPATITAAGGSGTATASYTYASPGTYTATVRLTDGQDEVVDTQVFTVSAEPLTVQVFPFLNSGGGYVVGRQVGAEIVAYDQTDRSPYEWQILWEGTEEGPVSAGSGVGAVAISDAPGNYTLNPNPMDTHVYEAAGTYTIVARVRSERAATWVASPPMTIEIEPANALPQITDVSVTPTSGTAPLPVELQAAFTDADVDDVMTASIDWGDGTTTVTGTEEASITFAEGAGTVTATHVYEDPSDGPYPITVTVHDGEATATGTAEVTVDAPVTPTTVTIDDVDVSQPGSEGPPVVRAGARDVPISSIPLGDLAPEGGDPDAAPLHRIDLSATPLHRIPLHRIPLHRIGLPQDEAPLTLGDLALDALPLDQLALTEVPLLRSGGWGTLLDGRALAGQPLQTLTLADVHGAGLLAALRADEVDLSATPLRDLSLASVLLGETSLADVPVPELDDGTTTDWCTYLTVVGVSCAGFRLDEALVGAEYAGLPLDTAGVTATPLHRIDVDGVPLHRIDIEGVPLHRIPLHRIPLHRIDLDVSPLHRIPLHRIPLHRIDIEQTPLHRIPLHRIPLHRIAEFVDCDAYDCTEAGGKTLADAYSDGALLDTATLGGLEDAVPEDLTVGHLLVLIAKAIEAGQDPDGLQITFNDILVGLYEAMDYPWEELPFGRMGVSRFAPYTGEAPLDYHVDFTVQGSPGPADTTLRLTLPEGFTVVTPEQAEGPVGELTTPGVDARVVDLEVDGSQVTAALGGLGAGSYQLALDVRPGITLGTFSSDVEVTATGGADGAPASDAVLQQAPVTVIEHWEDTAANEPTTAPQLAGDTVYLAHLGTTGDSDYYRVPVAQPGQRISVRLTNLDADADLVMYQPVDPSSVPLHRISTDSLPLSDEGHSSASGRSELAPEVLQDVPVEVSPLHRISANRGDADEVIEAVATGADVDAGGYVIQVSGYNGAASTTPYALRVKLTQPPPAPVCTNTFVNDVPAPAVDWSASSVPGGVDTLFLVNEHRMRRLADGTAVDDTMAALGELIATEAGHDTRAAIVPLDRIGPVVDAYAAWDAPGAGCDPAAANAVVESAAGVVDDLLQAHPTVENVVVVGGDDVVPFARIPDTTRYNQRTYADLVGDVNPISSAFATEHLLSDDPYGDAAGTPWLNRRLHVAEVAVGRLVESPEDIAAQLRQFVASGGRVDPGTALVTGYDFLTDGADAVSDGLAAGTTQRRTIVPDELIDETWSRQDIVDRLFPAQGASPDVASINAHYDHSRSLPAAPHAEGDESDASLFTIADIAPDRLVGRVLFTMGCHAGLAVPDRYAGTQAAAADDWARSFGSELAVFVANTGYGYGDDTAVALSEKLMANLADRLDGTMTVGDALAAAKHAYVGEMGVYGSYDEKVVQQTVLYGLPMYRVGPEPGPTVDDGGSPGTGPIGTTVDPVTGLQVAPAGADLGGGGLVEVATDRGRHWQVPGTDPQVTHWRPIQPKTVVDVTKDGLAARGALITGLASTDQTGVDAVFARPSVGPSAQEPEVESGGVAFPARLSNLTTTGGPEGRKDRLTLMPGQFFSDENPTSTLGTQRLYTRMDAVVYYGDATGGDATPPQIDSSEAYTEDGVVSFATEVSDASDVKRVLVLYKDATGLWRALDLADQGGRWAASAAADVGVGPEPVLEWFVQAVDGAGNVAASTNKGRMFPAFVPGVDGHDPDPVVAPTGPVAPTIEGPVGTSGWFTGPVTITGPEDQTSSPAAISDDGVHVVTVTRNGVQSTHVVALDSTDPTATVTAPVDGREVQMAEPLTASYACEDATSGVAGCTATVTPPSGGAVAVVNGGRLPTDAAGTYQLVVTATDVAGNTSITSATYQVIGHRYRFDGFFAPIDDDVVNEVKAGQGVPVKFRVHDGDQLVSDVAVLDVDVVPTTCPADSSTNPVTEEVTTTNVKSELRWDPEAQQFVYLHKSEKKWTGCRKVVVTVAHPDGATTAHEVLFRYRK